MMHRCADGPSAELLRPALVRAVRETGASVGAVYLLSPDEGALLLAVLTGVPRRIARPWGRLPVGDPIPVAEAVRERRLVWVRSQAELARRYPRAALVMPYHFALAAAPIAGGSTTWGALVLQWPSARPSSSPSAYEREVVATTCARMGGLLQRAADGGVPDEPAGTEAPGGEPYGPGSPAAEFAGRLPEGCCSLDVDGRITFLDGTAADLLGGSAADLVGALLWDALPWLEEPVFDDRYRAAAISHQPTSATVRRPPDRWLDFHLFPDASGVSLCISPAADADASDDTGIDADAGTDRAGAGRRARQEAPSGSGSLYDLMQLTATLTEAVRVRDVVELAADQIMPAFGAQGFVVSVAEGGKLHVVGHRGYPPKVIARLDHPPFRDDRAPTVRALRSGAPLFLDSPRAMAEINPDIPGRTGRSAWAFLPLITSGHPVGCCVISYDRPHPFTPDERAVLTSLAALLAQALDRARLYDAKHQLANTLQSGLHPTSLPTVPGLEAAARYLPTSRGLDVGGDFYDLIRCDATTVAATIGDVQGHNVNAAALMGQVRTAVHATAGAAPGEVLARANRLLADLDTGLLTSCLYAHLDLARGRAHLAGAGHPPPLLRHPDGHTEVLHLPSGLLLGVDPHADYQAVEVPLPPGSVLALYTDGLVERPGVGLDDAVTALADRLTHAPERPMDAVADGLVRPVLRPGARADSPSDDIALLLLHPRPDAA